MLCCFGSSDSVELFSLNIFIHISIYSNIIHISIYSNKQIYILFELFVTLIHWYMLTHGL